MVDLQYIAFSLRKGVAVLVVQGATRDTSNVGQGQKVG